MIDEKAIRRLLKENLIQGFRHASQVDIATTDSHASNSKVFLIFVRVRDHLARRLPHTPSYYYPLEFLYHVTKIYLIINKYTKGIGFYPSELMSAARLHILDKEGSAFGTRCLKTRNGNFWCTPKTLPLPKSNLMSVQWKHALNSQLASYQTVPGIPQLLVIHTPASLGFDERLWEKLTQLALGWNIAAAVPDDDFALLCDLLKAASNNACSLIRY